MGKLRLPVATMPRRIDAAVVSYGYGDVLAHSLVHNRLLFDRMVVMTGPDDTMTQEVCRHYYVEHVVTEAFTAANAAFNKGAAIAEGLEHLGFTDWVVHLDADIVLPPRAATFLRELPLDEQCLYGVDRLMVPNWDTWVGFLAAPIRQHYDASVWPIPFPMGYRCFYHGAYTPIGFFQMFNRHSMHLGEPLYPTGWPTAANSDVEFAMRWPAERRLLIPEMFVYHLGSDDASVDAIGTNWEGRRSAAFGPRKAQPCVSNS